jgi:hypothetical protein
MMCLQPEPFFLSFSLYNAKESKKISEDFHFDPNSPQIRAMIPVEILRSNSVSLNAKQSVENGASSPEMLWLELQKQVSGHAVLFRNMFAQRLKMLYNVAQDVFLRVRMGLCRCSSSDEKLRGVRQVR